MKKTLLLVVFTILLNACCYNSAKLRVLNSAYQETTPRISYEGSNMHYQELRLALMEHGIKALKHNVSTELYNLSEQEMNFSDDNIKSSSASKKFIGNRVEGTRLSLEITDKLHPDIICLTGSGAKVYTLFVEITDLDTKEVIFTIKAKGFDNPCGYCRKTVYQNVAEKIENYFQSR